MDNYEKELLEKIDSNYHFSECELKDLLDFEIEQQEGGERRWTRSIRSIVCIGGRHFAIWWERGLTEYQDNYYSEQPVEVKLQEYQKTITVRDWVVCQ